MCEHRNIQSWYLQSAFFTFLEHLEATVSILICFIAWLKSLMGSNRKKQHLYMTNNRFSELQILKLLIGYVLDYILAWYSDLLEYINL